MVISLGWSGHYPRFCLVARAGLLSTTASHCLGDKTEVTPSKLPGKILFQKHIVTSPMLEFSFPSERQRQLIGSNFIKCDDCKWA